MKGKGWHLEPLRHSLARKGIKTGRKGYVSNPRTITPKSREVFRRRYKGQKNFITPNVIEYGKIGNKYSYELSWGEGIFNREDKIYGVSVLTNEGKKVDELKQTNNNLSRSFNNRKKAEKYIDKLNDDVKDGFEPVDSKKSLEGKTVCWVDEYDTVRKHGVIKEFIARGSVPEMNVRSGETKVLELTEDSMNGGMIIPKDWAVLQRKP
jgi:hypothetical protein